LRHGDYVRLADGRVWPDASGSDLSFDWFGGDWLIRPAEARLAVPADGVADRARCDILLARRTDDLVALADQPRGFAFCVRTTGAGSPGWRATASLPTASRMRRR
jgi:hypothetical protein